MACVARNRHAKPTFGSPVSTDLVLRACRSDGLFVVTTYVVFISDRRCAAEASLIQAPPADTGLRVRVFLHVCVRVARSSMHHLCVRDKGMHLTHNRSETSPQLARAALMSAARKNSICNRQIFGPDRPPQSDRNSSISAVLIAGGLEPFKQERV